MKTAVTLIFVLCTGITAAFIPPSKSCKGIIVQPLPSRKAGTPPTVVALAGAASEASMAQSYIRTKTLNVLNSAMLLTMTSDVRQFPTISGFVVAAGVSHMLSGAAEHGRLTSDTYKRLNLALFAFYTLGLIGIPGGLAPFQLIPKSAFYVVGAAFGQAYGAFLTYKGWRMGFDGSVLGELKRGLQSTLSSLFRTKGRGYVFSIALLVSGIGAAHNIAALTKYARLADALKTSQYVCGLGRITLLSSMIFSLKDAAERDRLTGTTFIQMNYLTALWLLLTAMGQSAQAGIKFVAPTRALIPAAVAFCAMAYVTTQEKQARDRQTDPPKPLEVIEE